MRRPLRVLQVTARYAPLTGGVETHVREVASRLADRGFHVSVLTTDLTGSLPPVDVSRDVHLIRVRAFPRTRDYYWSPDVYRVAARGYWDIIHCQGIHTFVPLLAMLAAIRTGTPFFVTFHSGGHSSHLRNAMRRVQWLFLAPFLRRAERLIAVSRFEARLFAGVPGIARRRIVVIPNGGDLPLQEEAEVAIDRNLIVSLGRLERYKGHQRAIAATALLVDRLPDVRLRIAGSGQYRNALERTARRLGVAERVTIESIESTDRRAMARLLARAAVVVLLSEYEAHAIAAIEAIALGRPVVVADATGLHDLVHAGLARGVPLTASPAEIAEAIHEEIISPGHRKTDMPTWDDAVARLAELYARASVRESTGA